MIDAGDFKLFCRHAAFGDAFMTFAEILISATSGKKRQGKKNR